jgi:hypothetical protein
MTDEEAIADFQRYLRSAITERLALREAVLGPVLSGHLSVHESEQALLDWLDLQSQIADRAFGRAFREPSMTALYADAAKETIEDLKKIVMETAEEIRNELRDKES